MTYGKDARVGNLTVFSREGAINAYKIFCKIFDRDMTMEANVVRTDAMLDMMELGFTPEEIENIELSIL